MWNPEVDFWDSDLNIGTIAPPLTFLLILKSDRLPWELPGQIWQSQRARDDRV